jgi:hypothetical protein
MNCPNCGAYIGDEDAFCGECGHPVPPKEQASTGPRPEDVWDQETELLPGPLPGSATGLPRSAAGTRPKTLRARWPLILAGAGASLLLCICAAIVALYLIGRSVATPTPAVVPPAATTLFEEGFEAPDSWSVYDDGDTWAEFAAEEYRLGIRRPNYVTWGTPEDLPQFTDFSIEVDARQVEGPLNNNLGLVVRYQDDYNFYWFQISSDGWYAVDMLQAGEWVSLVSWKQSPAIQQGPGAVNRLRLQCDGSRFDFYANDTYLATVSDASYATGSIGLAAGAYDEPGVVIHFDNLRVMDLQK